MDGTGIITDIITTTSSCDETDGWNLAFWFLWHSGWRSGRGRGALHCLQA